MSRGIHGTIIILDIGRNVSTKDEEKEKSFFERAKECVARILERKILSQDKSMVGIMLLGSKKTNNKMANEHAGAFKHIEIFAELQSPTWKMIRSLPEKATEVRGDWFDALLVAADYFANVFSGVKLVSRNIVLMTNFKKKTTFDTSGIDEVLNGFQEQDFQVSVIGPDIYSKEYENDSTEIIKQFVEATGGVAGTLENIMKYDLQFHRKKVVNANSWDVDLSIGPNINIPVSCYIKLKDEPTVKKWEKSVRNPVTCASSKSESVVKTREYVNQETGRTVDASEKLKGYHYGQAIIPFQDCDKSMLYQPGVKSLSVYGFTSADNIKWQHLNGDGLSYVFGKKDDPKAQKAIRCLVECLHELNLVGIVRKVHNNNNVPKMFALMPVIDTNNYVCLSMAAICYKDDIKQMSFPATNLKKYKYSQEQVDAFKELIGAMDLTKAYDDTFDDTEAFPVAECVSPSAQYVLDCLAFRAMNPGKPLPEPREEIMTLFKVPPLLEENAKKPLEKLKSLFTLTKIEVKKRSNKNAPIDIDQFKVPLAVPSDNPNIPNMPKIHLPTKDAVDDIKNISTINPIEDFKTLQNKNKPLSELTTEMIKAIESLITNNIDGDFTKALDAMAHLRTELLKSDPTDYNNWIKKLKADLVESDKNRVLELIMAKKLSFILKEENNLSTYEDEQSHDESQMYENDTIPNSAEFTINTEVQNMFDD
ncbi:hypothetical protein B5X24_HaOG209462 [Helicoverpa armigera]|uniref:Ku domain-containing protein n=1 Tax=Helicoverpa armigera TaxID=29058 RepID=A0A2W1BLE4_HELAM|nr:hypothetical protein B5X24_HaOG209462 [Helicoverpa armigera]